MKKSKRNASLRPMIPQGVQCYFGEEVNRRRKVESILAATMRNWGFQEIILPFFDYLEDFSYGLGPHIGDQVYRFLDRDGSLLALRPDLTTLVAKTVATRMTDHPQPIKLFYSGEVFRQERAGAGRQKEFYQVGLESIGSVMLWADIEVILLAIECLLQLGVRDFKIALGHVGFFNGIISVLNLPPDRADALRNAIDHKDSAWLRKEIDVLEISREKKDFLADLPDFAGGRQVLEGALSVVENTRSREALNELVQIHSTVESLGLQDYLIFDLAEVRGLDYYTGILFKIYGRAQGFELGGGGRYDGLLRKFGWDLPAVGFSFTMDRLLPLIRETGRLEVPLCGAAEHVIAVGSASPGEAFQRVWQLRRQGERVRVGGS
jgi:ATP phosphoribosyltransferase regulatory subunit